MSCDGWSIGDNALARAAFRVGELRYQAGSRGQVVEVNTQRHQIVVMWSATGRRVRFSHEQIHEFLERDDLVV